MRLRFDRKDAQSELLLALLEEVRDCDPGAPGVGASVLRAAHGRAWAHARAALRERAVATVPDSPASWDPLRACDGGPAAEEQEAAASLPDAAGEATAPCPARAPAVRAAGERIGMLAQRFGLDSVAVRARYTGPGGRGERGARAGLLRLGGRRNR
ncbi:hypothetical protein [Streptomyces sp. NPDC047014]|uniref:hypothetical protein n=1 Tax=Streptomyces sp. NPDC047014 TaxID=3155736 RepID=UPI0033C8BDE2